MKLFRFFLSLYHRFKLVHWVTGLCLVALLWFYAENRRLTLLNKVIEKEKKLKEVELKQANQALSDLQFNFDNAIDSIDQQNKGLSALKKKPSNTTGGYN